MKPILTCSLAARIVALVLFVPAQLSFASNEPSSAKCTVYAKIILPVVSPCDGTHPIVESWISKKLHKRGKSDLRAVTQWVRLAEKGEKVAHVWNATVDEKRWGCPVVGRVVQRTMDSKFKVELSGWSPVGAEIKGQTLAAEIGSWFNMAEFERSALSHQCLANRIDQMSIMQIRVAKWEEARNKLQATANWQFTTTDARIKLRSLYPSINT